MDLFSPRHLLVILAIALLVFGTKKLKSLGSDLGSAVKGFKQAMKEGESDEAAPPAPAAPAAAPKAELAGPARSESPSTEPASTRAA